MPNFKGKVVKAGKLYRFVIDGSSKKQRLTQSDIQTGAFKENEIDLTPYADEHLEVTGETKNQWITSVEIISHRQLRENTPTVREKIEKLIGELPPDIKPTDFLFSPPMAKQPVNILGALIGQKDGFILIKAGDSVLEIKEQNIISFEETLLLPPRKVFINTSVSASTATRKLLNGRLGQRTSSAIISGCVHLFTTYLRGHPVSVLTPSLTTISKKRFLRELGLEDFSPSSNASLTASSTSAAPESIPTAYQTQYGTGFSCPYPTQTSTVIPGGTVADSHQDGTTDYTTDYKGDSTGD